MSTSVWDSARPLSLALLCALVCALAACPSTTGEDDGGTLEPAPAPAEPDPFHDPLSMPEEPTLSTNNFIESEACGSCHEQHYAEWRTSMHAYAITDPVFRGLVAARQADLAGTEDQFCMQCHTPLGVRSGQVPDNFTFEALDAVAKDGISCETCHKTTEVVRPYNNGHKIDEFGAMMGPIEDPRASNFHASQFTEHMGKSNFCGACHDVIETSGLNLERPYAEWLESPANDDGRTCQSCHMPTYEGQAATSPPGAPTRELHRHTWTGVDIPLVDGVLNEEEIEEQKGRIRELLTDIAHLTLSVEENEVSVGDQIDLYVNVENLLDSHNLPTGSTFIRQMWVEVIARDSTGKLLYQTGDLDANDDLKNHFSLLEPYADNDLISLGSELIDANGTPTIYTWRAIEHTSYALGPLYDRTYTLFVPTRRAAPGPIDITARLRFRSHAPHILRAVGMDEVSRNIDIYDLASDDITVAVDGDAPPTDAGVIDGGAEDAGAVEVDAGADAGAVEVDAGADAGPVEDDAGVPEIDGGRVDAGGGDAG